MSPIYKRIQYQKLNGFDVPYWDIDTIPDASPSPSPSITPTPSITPSITPSNTITPSVTQTPSTTPTITPSITQTPSTTPTITPSVTQTPSTTLTITPTSSITPTPSITSTPTLTPSTSPDPCPACNEFEIINNDLSNSLTVEYTDCNTYSTEILVIGANTTDYQCSCDTPIRVFGSTDYVINFNGVCPL